MFFIESINYCFKIQSIDTFFRIQYGGKIQLPSLNKLNDFFLSSITGETATKEIHLQNAPEQSPETLAPRQVAPSDSILEEAEDDEEHKTQNASSSSCQSDGFKIPASPVSIAFMYILNWKFSYVMLFFHLNLLQL